MTKTLQRIQGPDMKLGQMIRTRLSQHYWDYATYLVILGVLWVFTTILVLDSSSAFDRYFGILHPFTGLAVVSILGFAILDRFINEGRFHIYSNQAKMGVGLAIALAPLFFLGTTVIDIGFRYPEDINVAIPHALLFYPTIGFVVEVIFHLLPLFVFWQAIKRVENQELRDRLLLVSMALVALAEPLFQIALGTPAGFPVWVVIIFGLLLFVFNSVQLLLLKNYDFLSMYMFRLVYYSLWHVLWGVMRLELLF